KHFKTEVFIQLNAWMLDNIWRTLSAGHLCLSYFVRTMSSDNPYFGHVMDMDIEQCPNMSVSK
ncbi:6233_t:CDS:1, partial [Scutellospora calospora]